MAYTKQEVITIIDTAHYLLASGTNTYTASATPALPAYVTGKPFYVKFTNANTGASTLNVNGLGAKNIYKSISTALVAGDIPASSIIEMVYDGASFLVIGGAILFVTIDQRIYSALANFCQSII